jgi:hypothetical protein
MTATNDLLSVTEAITETFDRAQMLMDLHTAALVNGRAWQLARVAAVLCFVVSAALFITSLMSAAPSRSAAATAPASAAMLLRP